LLRDVALQLRWWIQWSWRGQRTTLAWIILINRHIEEANRKE
jgi:hypothetical protein